MSFTAQLVWVLGGLIALIALSGIRSRRTIATTKDGALTAISHIQHWAQWMAGIQTAALAGLALMVFDDKAPVLRPLPEPAPLFALASLLYLGAALFCSAWVMSSLPSQTIRIHAHQGKNSDLCEHFDVYEQKLYEAIWSPRLGYLLTLKHYLWAVGLLNLAFFAGTLLASGKSHC